nr:putative protein TPRXL [Rhipicephalus microplus]
MHGTSCKAAGLKQSPRQTGPSPALARARKLQAAKGSHTTGKAGNPAPTSRPLNRAAPVPSGRTAKSGATPSSSKPVDPTTTCSKAAMLSSSRQDVHESEEGSTTLSSTSSPSSSSSWEHETPPSSPNTGTESEKEETASPKPKRWQQQQPAAPPSGQMQTLRLDVTNGVEIDREYFESLRR